MSGGDILTLITVFVLAAFVGFEVISKVPSVLHTPLMSGTNAIHGVVLVGSMIVLGTGHGALEVTLGFLAVLLATVNVVGGFVVTDRMLEMFKGRQPARATPAEAAASEAPLPEPPVPEAVFSPSAPEATAPAEPAPGTDPTEVLPSPTVADPTEVIPRPPAPPDPTDPGPDPTELLP